MQPSRDGWGIADLLRHLLGLRAGRRCAEFGGFPTDSVTEDFLLTLALQDTRLEDRLP